MAPIQLLEATRAARKANRHGLVTTNQKCSGINEDLVKSIDASTIDNKIVFFRLMGLEISKVCDIDSGTNNNTSNTINNNKDNCTKLSDLQSSPKRPCESSNRISSYDITGDRFSFRSKAKRHNNKRTNHSGDMVDSQKIVELTRECRVMIIGEKCRVCGKSFKCIKDVQLHVRKKHRKRKPRTKVVLRIGSEVISTVPIRRKHLKRVHLEDDRAIVNSIDSVETRLNEEIISDNDRINNERLATPLIDLEDICDIVDTESDRAKVTDRDVLLSPLGNTSVRNLNSYENDDDEDIREVLRITRSPLLGPTINHETPNRTERELLLSDAIREFDRMDHDPMDMIEFVEEEKALRDENNDVIEDYCWLADGNLQNSHLDLVENNCSYHIENDYDIDFTLDGVNSLTREMDPKYFDDENENAFIHSTEYRRENGDIVPDFIDYAQCLDDNRATINHNNNNNKNNNSGNVYELESSFYNEARISEWNKLTRVPKSFDCDIRQRTKRNVDPSVLIKEEIILEDIL